MFLHLPQYYIKCLFWHLLHCYCPQSGPPVGWINTSVSCLVKLPLWCCDYITLVPLVLWVMTVTSTPLQLSWLVDWHGVDLLSLCFGWLIPKRMVVDPWSMGFTVLSFMVIYLFHLPFCWKEWGDHDEDWGFGWWLPQWNEVGSPRVVKKKCLVQTFRAWVIVACAAGFVLWCKHYHCEWGTKPCLLQELLYWLPPGTIMQWSSVFYNDASVESVKALLYDRCVCWECESTTVWSLCL